jgi:hypothetical protein
VLRQSSSFFVHKVMRLPGVMVLVVAEARVGLADPHPLVQRGTRHAAVHLAIRLNHVILVRVARAALRENSREVGSGLKQLHAIDTGAFVAIAVHYGVVGALSSSEVSVIVFRLGTTLW